MKIKLQLQEAFNLRNNLGDSVLNSIQHTKLAYAIEKSRRGLAVQLKKFQYKPSEEAIEYEKKRGELANKLHTPIEAEKAAAQAELDALEKANEKIAKELEKMEKDFQSKLENDYEFEVHEFKDTLPENLTPAQMKAVMHIVKEV
jgi:hypothetical protein